MVNHPYPKLSYKFFGPYSVLERIGAVAYRLQLPSSTQVHPVFHVSELKPFIPKYTPVFDELPSVPDLAAAAIEPEDILERRLVRSGNAAATQVLIKWRGLIKEQATWEDYDLLKLRFPANALWEADHAQVGGGSVTPSEPNGASVDIELPVQRNREPASVDGNHTTVKVADG